MKPPHRAKPEEQVRGLAKLEQLSAELNKREYFLRNEIVALRNSGTLTDADIEAHRIAEDLAGLAWDAMYAMRHMLTEAARQLRKEGRAGGLGP